VARLSVAHTEVPALTVHGQENIRAVGPMIPPCQIRGQGSSKLAEFFQASMAHISLNHIPMRARI